MLCEEQAAADSYHHLLYMQMQLNGAKDSIFMHFNVSEHDLLHEGLCLAVCRMLPLQS